MMEEQRGDARHGLLSTLAFDEGFLAREGDVSKRGLRAGVSNYRMWTWE